MPGMISLGWRMWRAGYNPAEIVNLLELRQALEGCSTVLDVGCGPTSRLRHFGFRHLAGIEGYLPSLEAARKNGTHHELVQGDVRSLENYFQAGQFDACVALDVIEHLTKEDGMKLMRSMERCASKRVVFLTPKGFLPQRHTANDDLQEHLSGWEVEEMRSLGYEVIGELGAKSLRGEYHALRHWPRFFWGIVSLLSHWLWTKRHPEKAAAILCVKKQPD